MVSVNISCSNSICEYWVDFRTNVFEIDLDWDRMVKVPKAEQHNDTGVWFNFIQYLLQYSTQQNFLVFISFGSIGLIPLQSQAWMQFSPVCF